MESKVVLPTPEPAKMPIRWPRQSGVNRSTTRTPVRNGARTRVRLIAGGGSGVRRHDPLSGVQCAGAIKRLTQCVEDPAFPAWMRREGLWRQAVCNEPQAGGDMRIERLGGDAVAVDANHFAELHLVLYFEPDQFAQSHKARQARYAISASAATSETMPPTRTVGTSLRSDASVDSSRSSAFIWVSVSLLPTTMPLTVRQANEWHSASCPRSPR